ncbi:unnamed protein product [Ectocarpus sp. CCAP 1310/34]|nr:unnamed protein product [Ectocarpus sp. CCAP 1310/34]
MDGSRGCGRGATLGGTWKALVEWFAEPFHSCRTRLGSTDRFHDHDEEDMTWVEYQWLTRTNHESLRLSRPPPRLNQCFTPPKHSITSRKDGGDNNDEASPLTPPITPPSQASATTHSNSSEPPDQ